jgi:5-methylcytosine-specific restriction endonuclease McrA
MNNKHNKKLDAALLWKQFADVLIPTLRLSVLDRAIYAHLLRHTHLEGRRSIRFSIGWLARGAGISPTPARFAVRRLVAQGIVRLLQRSRAGHEVEVRLPSEIAPVSSKAAPAKDTARLPRHANLEQLDFSQNRSLRLSIHARERGFCFYCLRRINPAVRCLDHVVPQVDRGRNSYRNLVSCCSDCNSEKSDQSAADFLRGLYRDRRLTGPELAARLRALDALAAGKLRPTLPMSANRAT